MMELSALPKTWILDVDGTLVKHNGYKIDGYDTLLDGVHDFYKTISHEDKIILLTARKGEFLEELKMFLKEHGLRYDNLICDMPMGERILINDNKPSGLNCAYAINKNRDEKLDVTFTVNGDL